MILLPSGQNVRVWIATGYTDMRCGFPSLALRVQQDLKLNPLDGNLFVFRGRSGSLMHRSPSLAGIFLATIAAEDWSETRSNRTNLALSLPRLGHRVRRFTTNAH